MKLAKRILLVSGILFIALQFIRPVHNKSNQVLLTDISKVITTPGSQYAHMVMPDMVHDVASAVLMSASTSR